MSKFFNKLRNISLPKFLVAVYTVSGAVLGFIYATMS